MSTRQKNLLLRWLAMTAVSIAAFIGCYCYARAEACKPGQIDEQCGFATLAGTMSGLYVGGATLLTATIYYTVAALKRRQAEQPTESEA
jgi:hypothetical protein